MTYNTDHTVSYPASKICCRVRASVQNGKITSLNISPLSGSKPLTAWVKDDIRAQLIRDYLLHTETEQAQAN